MKIAVNNTFFKNNNIKSYVVYVQPGYGCVNSLNKQMKSGWRLLHAVPHKGKAGNGTWAGKEGCEQWTKGAVRDPAFLQLLPYLLVHRHDSGQGLLCSSKPFSHVFLYECYTIAKLNAKVKIHFYWHLTCWKAQYFWKWKTCVLWLADGKCKAE